VTELSGPPVLVPPPSFDLPGPGPFRWTEEIEPATGWRIYTLRYDPPSKSEGKVVRVCPDGGSNLFSYAVGGLELLHPPDDIRRLRGGGSGTPVLYPTPNRIRDGRFTFEGKRFQFRDDGQIHIHGLVRTLGWQSEPPQVKAICPESPAGCVELKTWIDFDPGTAPYAMFPYRHTLTLRFVLTAKGVRVHYEVKNRDTERLPFGFALHPYFAVPGEREQVYLRVPAEAKMEATPDLLPTGKLLPLDGAPFDLRRPRMLGELKLDDVFIGLRTPAPAGYEIRDARVRVDLPASEDFTHMVVFTPPHVPEKMFFCMENQTCSTDAHNLHAKGLVREAHLRIVEPGGTAAGWAEFRAVRY
jgi:aldose 1-epimerase